MEKIRKSYFILGIIYLCCILTSCTNNKMQTIQIDVNIIPIGVTSDENKLYIIGNEYDKEGNLISPQLYSMDKNNYEIVPFTNLTFSETLKPVAIAMGNDNHIYIVVREEIEKLKHEIWKISTTGKVEDKYDISDSIDENQHEGIKSFLLDSMGNFYIRERVSDEIILINNIGNEVLRIQDDSHEMSFESMSRDYQGNVYALFCIDISSGGGYTLFTYLNGKKVKEYYSEELLPYNDIYSIMGYNSNNRLNFKGLFGIYDYSISKKKTKKIMDLSLNKYNYTKSCFDNSGNLFIFAVYKLEDFNATDNIELMKYHF